MLAARSRLLLVTIWAGSLWSIGYLVAPTLFATLSDRALAGTIAGSLFHIESWISLACAVLLLALLKWGAADLAWRARRTLALVVLAMLLCSLITQFAIFPMVAALREAAGPGGVAGSPVAARFGMLHGVSMLIYLVQSVLAVVLVWKQK